MRQTLFTLALLSLGGFGAGAAIAQGTVPLAMLSRIEPGLWELRARTGGAAQRICIDEGRRLIQLRHPDIACKQFVVEDEASSVTVHYACPGKGSGRTHVRFETPRLVQIETTGIARGFPFDVAAEARRVGDCSPT